MFIPRSWPQSYITAYDKVFNTIRAYKPLFFGNDDESVPNSVQEAVMHDMTRQILAALGISDE